jgi:hypothetical protein
LSCKLQCHVHCTGHPRCAASTMTRRVFWLSYVHAACARAGLTWDVRLALALQEATADISVGGQLWELYSRLLPAPHEVTVPFCLPSGILKEMQHAQLAKRAQAQKDRLTG